MIITAPDLPRVVQCIGSPSMATIPAVEGNTVVRDEGNAAHYLVEQGGDIFSYVDKPAKNGVIITAEMAEHVDDYFAIITARADIVASEFNVNTDWNPTANHFVSGVCDNITYTMDGTLYIHDLRYGYRVVEPENNITMISHAIGWVMKTGVTPSRIVFAVFQPRVWHPEGMLREHIITYEELMTEYNKISSVLATGGNQLKTGSECHNCPSMGICPAFRLVTGNAIEVAHVAFTDDIPNEAVSVELDLLKRVERIIKDRLDALETLAYHRIARGEVVENYALERSPGNRRWKEEYKDPERLSTLCGKDMRKTGAISPAQAEKLIPKLFVELATERPPGALKLTRISADKRAKRIFGKT